MGVRLLPISGRGWPPFRLQQNSTPNRTEGLMSPQEHKVERRLAAIFAADVAGYSRLMERDE
ncbi:hypothetical protein, partial [Microvirga aerophila]|uniref:hypothetical protein n=1 Tax=Microvirga aerophila TaxID=670291 RepID=UPI0035A2525E